MLADAYLAPIEEDYAREHLLSKYTVKELPTLVIIDKHAKIITVDAISDLKKLTKA